MMLLYRDRDGTRKVTFHRSILSCSMQLRRSRAQVLRAVILQRKIRDCSQSMKKPPKKIVSNYLNGAFLMLTPAQILPVTVLSQESVFYPIRQCRFRSHVPVKARKRCQYFFGSRRSNRSTNQRPNQQ